MVKVTIRQEFPYPLETVVLSREHRFSEPENQPGLQSQELLEKTTQGPVIITRRLMKFGQSVPEIIRKMVPADMLHMTDTNHFNTITCESSFFMISDFAPNALRIEGSCPYVQVHEQLTFREYTLQVKASIPIIGNAVEKAIMQSYKDGLEKDHQIMLRACARLHQQA